MFYEKLGRKFSKHWYILQRTHKQGSKIERLLNDMNNIPNYLWANF